MVANTTASRKSKGRTAQNKVRDLLRHKYQGLLYGDIEARQMGGTGTDIILSPTAKNIIPFDIEVKAQESLNIWAALEQAEQNSTPGRTPLLCFKRNRTDLYCALKFEDLLRLL